MFETIHGQLVANVSQKTILQIIKQGACLFASETGSAVRIEIMEMNCPLSMTKFNSPGFEYIVREPHRSATAVPGR